MSKREDKGGRRCATAIAYTSHRSAGGERRSADKRGVADTLEPSTLVLSLLGTYGDEPAWRDRTKSDNHAFVPLASAETVRAAPMIAQLFLELGLPLDWVEEEDQIRVDSLPNIDGAFFVDDARQAVDSEGRKIIGARDFVHEHGIRSVFGVGGSWSDGTLFCLIAFTTEELTRDTAQKMLSFSELFHRLTVATREANRLFPEP